MLNKSILIGITILIWVISPAISFAEKTPPGKWWRIPRVSEHLNLSDQEKRELDKLYVDNRRKLIELKSILERERFELENLLEQETLDEAAVMEQFKKLEGARANLAIERFRFLLQVRKIIGFERFQRLKMLSRKFRSEKMSPQREKAKEQQGMRAAPGNHAVEK
ncbi:MAG: periplasmic heavy metal sensor [Deltaproteobacteria bacterium]|nr:periplasmic heavy metal sensor [Deltaproteobacteria bacterium]